MADVKENAHPSLKNAPYPHAEASPSFSKMEEEVLAFWNEQKVFESSVENRAAKHPDGSNNEFIFYDGPPFANGLPHYGHLLTGYKKDLIARYQTQKGHRVERRFGWDCHGLPAEMGAEKELAISGRHQIMEYGIDKFNNYCRTSVMQFTKEWHEYVTRQGRWVDFENDYKTMETPYMESVIWAFKELYKKGLIYKAMRVMPYSWVCQTPLSNFETRMDNCYREVADKAITVGFEINNKPKFLPDGYSSYKILAWTTTPWTLPSNLALTVSPTLNYVAIDHKGECLVLAEFALKNYLKEFGEDEVIARFSGKELKGLTYQPLFSYFSDHPHGFQVLVGDFVEEGEGTGVVHTAPGFGEDDQVLCQEYGIELVCPVDEGGKFTKEISDYEGMQVFDTNEPIIIKLKEQGSWYKTDQYLHNYPHCWRTDTPLIYKAVPSWYVKVTEFKDRMVELNQQINWVPEHIRDGLFGKWLENARDWSISRNRFWGTPIPVWESDDPAYPRIDVYGSIEELEKDFGVKVEDLHRPFIDDLTRPNPDDPTGKSKMVRVSDVFDCWFESGSMPYAQVHYPFDNKTWFDEHFPADFITEYVAQTRGWFYTMMVLSTALFDRPPFKNCVCHGVILDEHGQKLSKRLQNYADPMEIFGYYGSDPLRWLMVSSSVMRGNELLIDKEGRMVRDVVRLAVKPLWNAYHFFCLYANADGVTARYDTSSSNVMDRYIILKTKDVLAAFEKAMDAYDTMTACQSIEQWLEVLNNWYIRRTRQRFWKAELDEDKQQAYNTLYTVLHVITRAVAPLLPFLSESIYQGLVNQGHYDASTSVHLTDFPRLDEVAADAELVTQMDRVRDVCNAALFLRNERNIRVRQPLSTLTLRGKGLDGLDDFADIIRDEVNVKSVEISSEIQDEAELKLQLHFPVLGKRLPAKMKQIIPAQKKGEWKKTDAGIEILDEVLLPEEYDLLLAPKNPENTQALSTQDAIVILDLTITEELRAEGIARDLIRLVQQARKDADFDISDRIDLVVESQDVVQKMIQTHEAFVKEQTLSASLTFGNLPASSAGFTAEGTLENETVKISITRRVS